MSIKHQMERARLMGLPDGPLLTPQQARAIRAYLGWTLETAAAHVEIATKTLLRFESGTPISAISIVKLYETYTAQEGVRLAGGKVVLG